MPQKWLPWGYCQQNMVPSGKKIVQYVLLLKKP